jgi:hypothetical protein
MDTRANKPRMTLLHFMVSEAVKENKDALLFVEEMSPDLNAECNRVIRGLFARVSISLFSEFILNPTAFPA